jgi:hypothetical protein
MFDNHGTLMTSEYDPSAALASVLAVLAQTKQRPSPSNSVQSNYHPSTLGRPLPPTNLDPVFTQGEILDTSKWIGTFVTPWYEPRPWQLPRLEKQPYPIPQLKPQPQPRIDVDLRTALRPISPPIKRKRSPSPERRNVPSTNEKEQKTLSFSTYSHAIKHVVLASQEEEFVNALRKMKTCQNDLESDLFEERSRILRKYESKLKMDQLLHSLGSNYTGEKVSPDMSMMLMKLLKEQEQAELKSFDEDVVRQWSELIKEQTKEMRILGIPYFGETQQEGENENRKRMLAFLDDLISGG